MDEELHYAPRAVLLQIIEPQRQQIATQAQQRTVLQEQVQLLMARVAELEHHDPPPWAKPNRPKPAQPRPPRKRREQAFVRRRDRPTATVTHALDGCPDCEAPLTGGWARARRQVIAIPLAPATVTEHVVLARCCPRCRRTCTPTLALSDQALGQHRVGLRLLGLIALLRNPATATT